MLSRVMFEIIFPQISNEYYAMMDNIRDYKNKTIQLEKELKRYREKEKTLHICPNVRGLRFDNIKLPLFYDSVSTDEEMGVKLRKYIYGEALPTRRRG